MSTFFPMGRDEDEVPGSDSPTDQGWGRAGGRAVLAGAVGLVHRRRAAYLDGRGGPCAASDRPDTRADRGVGPLGRPEVGPCCPPWRGFVSNRRIDPRAIGHSASSAWPTECEWVAVDSSTRRRSSRSASACCSRQHSSSAALAPAARPSVESANGRWNGARKVLSLRSQDGTLVDRTTKKKKTNRRRRRIEIPLPFARRPQMCTACSVRTAVSLRIPKPA